MSGSNLSHAGILGMKWGVRKRPISDPKKLSQDHKAKLSLKKKKLSEMSNDDLKKLTQRMQLEKQYKDLSSADISKGKKIVSDILISSGKQLASTYVTKYASKGLDSALELISKAK